MIKSKTKLGFTVALICALLCASSGLILTASAAGDPLFGALNGSEDIVVTENVTASFTADAARGTMITSYNENSMAALNREIEGDFEIAFRFNPLEQGTGAQFDRKIDFKVLDIFFVDCADESNYFSVQIAGDSYWGSNYLKAMAVYRDFKGGVNQDAGGAVIAPGTTVNGSFEASSPYDQRTVIAYDDDTRRVLGSTYAGGGDDPMMAVVADLDDPAHVGQNVFKGFSAGYEVRIRMSGLVEPTNRNRPAKMVVYSVNGQSVNVSSPANNAGPNAFTRFVSKGVAGRAYKLPAAATYDLLSGKGDFKDNPKNTITVIDPDENKTVLPPDAAAFTPALAGRYSVAYTAYDADGTAGRPNVYSLEVLSGAPDVTVTLTRENRKTVAVGKTFSLSPASAASALSLLPGGAVDCTVSVRRGDEVILSERNAEAGYEVTFDAAGPYTVIYTGRDYLGGEAVLQGTIECRNEPNVTFGKIEGEVFVGRSFTVPAASASYNGGSLPVEVTLTDPYGKTEVVTAGAYTPAFNGQYLLRYNCRYGEGMAVVETVAVSVGVMPASMFYNVKNTAIEANASAPAYSMPAAGITITGAGEGATAKFSNVVDVTDVTKEDVFLEFQVTPKTSGKPEFKKLFVYMTDITDPDNKITLEFIVSQWDNRWSYVKAAGDKNRLLGIWQDGTPDSEGNYPILDNFNGGTQLRNSFAGVPYMDTKTKLFKVYYDNGERALYAEDHLGIKQMIIDMDDPAMVGGGKEWKGFASGQVEISFKFAETVSSEASILVSNVAGQRLGGTSIEDVTPPSISVDALAPMPVALAGKPYRVPSAVAYDVIDGRIERIDAACYDDGGARLPVEDGFVLPPEKGRYTLVYTCADRSGNETSVSVEFLCKSALGDIDISYDKELSRTAFVGETFYIPSVSVRGGSTVTRVSRYLIFGNKSLKVNADGSFIPTAAGRYKLVHIVEDYIGSRKEFTDLITVSVSQAPVGKFPTLFGYAINGASYVLPEFDATDYNLSPSEAGYSAETQIQVKYRGNVTTLGGDRVFVPQVDESGDTVTVIYTAKGSRGEARKEYEITVVTPVYAYDYFSKEGVTPALYTDAAGFTAEKSFAAFGFINPVPSKYVEVSFSVPVAANEFDYLDVWFSDAADGDNAFFVRVHRREAGESGYYKTSYAQINARGRKIEIPGSFYGNTNAPFKLDYDRLTGSVYAYGGSEIGKATETFAGYTLKPFGETAYVSFSFGNVSGDAEIRVNKIVNQSFFGEEGKPFQDSTPPVLDVKGVYDKSAEPDDEITVFAATAIDIIDPFVTVTVSVLAPDRTVLIDKAPAEERKLKLTQYGNYRISYEAKDSSGRRFVYTVLVKVEDLVPPVVTVGELPATAVLGKAFTLPVITVTDDNDPNPLIGVFIRTPQGSLVRVTDGTYTPTVKGKNTLIVFARDGDYSYTVYEKSFTVTEAKK